LKLNRKEKITIILTTHYMDEADYLCQRIGIIDFGKIVALDNAENLKDILGGDVISIETDIPEKAFAVFREFQWVEKISRHNGIIDLNCKQGEKKIPFLIKIDQKKVGFNIRSINLRKPTLEDVFLHFTGKTIREREASQEEQNKIRMRRRFKMRH